MPRGNEAVWRSGAGGEGEGRAVRLSALEKSPLKLHPGQTFLIIPPVSSSCGVRICRRCGGVEQQSPQHITQAQKSSHEIISAPRK